MQDSGCEQEPAVMSCVVSGQWDTQLEAHVESCANCRESVRLSEVLRTIAATPKPQLPPADYVWWQSRVRRRRDELKRVTRLFAMMRATIVVVTLIGSVGWIAWRWSEVGSEMKSSLDSFSHWSSLGLASNATLLAYVSAGLLCINVLLTIRPWVGGKK